MHGSDIVSNEKDETFTYMLIIELWILHNISVLLHLMNVIWHLFISVDLLCVRDSDRPSVYLVIYSKYVLRNFMLAKHLITSFLVLPDCMRTCKTSFFFYLFTWIIYIAVQYNVCLLPRGLDGCIVSHLFNMCKSGWRQLMLHSVDPVKLSGSSLHQNLFFTPVIIITTLGIINPLLQNTSTIFIIF